MKKIKKEKVYIFLKKMIKTMQLKDISSDTSQRILIKCEIII